MEYKNLGRSGLQVSVVGLGCNNFGMRCDYDQSEKVVHAAIDAGITLFDTADVYGGQGKSEEFLGRILKGKRDSVVVATKWGMKMGEGPHKSGGSRKYIMAAVEDSLRRLQTDYIDLYQLHRPDPQTPMEETLRALDDLVRQGKVLYLGASNYAAYRLMESLWVADRHGLARFVSFQPEYSLVQRSIEREHVPLCTKFGLGIIPWSPLAGGFLSGKYKRGEEPPPNSRLAKWRDRLPAADQDRHWGVLATLNEVAAALSVSPSQVALAWVLQRPGVTSAIFGARNPEQLEDNVNAAALKLSSEQVAALDAASSVPMGYPYDFMARVQGAW